jgi:hypothetical protein
MEREEAMTTDTLEREAEDYVLAATRPLDDDWPRNEERRQQLLENPELQDQVSAYLAGAKAERERIRADLSALADEMKIWDGECWEMLMRYITPAPKETPNTKEG